ncbi:MAG: DUF3391 domain-containing protein, partial [Aquabacterium sp.]|nr:DUF3391 domain-containing protein [Aquabacterium sp.]
MSKNVVVEDLQVGMFVHLDLGWWAHPFALSSFLITSADQISTIRGLGLKQLRWSPEKSRLPVPPQPPGNAQDSDAIVVRTGPTPTPTHTDDGAVVPATGGAPAAADTAAAVAPVLAARARAVPGP